MSSWVISLAAWWCAILNSPKLLSLVFFYAYGCFACMYECTVCMSDALRDHKRVLDFSYCGNVLVSNLQLFLFGKCSYYELFPSYRIVQERRIQVPTIQFHFSSVHMGHTFLGWMISLLLYTGLTLWKWFSPRQGICIMKKSLTSHHKHYLHFGELCFPLARGIPTMLWTCIYFGNAFTVTV